VARPDPYRAFRFLIEIQGLVQGGFRTVSGIERQTTVEPYREGGVNDFEHQFAVKTTFPPLSLQQGLVDTTLWDWHQDVIDGSITRRDVTIELLDETGRQAWRWVCQGAYPAKWSGADLDAVSGSIATESVELVHHGIRRQ
jgi:phage tail-like protein